MQLVHDGSFGPSKVVSRSIVGTSFLSQVKREAPSLRIPALLLEAPHKNLFGFHIHKHRPHADGESDTPHNYTEAWCSRYSEARMLVCVSFALRFSREHFFCPSGRQGASLAHNTALAADETAQAFTACVVVAVLLSVIERAFFLRGVTQ